MEKYIGLSETEQACLEKCREMEDECRNMWVRAMGFSPKLACYCTHWSDFKPSDWARMLVDNREIINIAPIHLLSCKEWSFVLMYQPVLIDHCPIVNDFSADTWEALTQKYPWFHKYRTIKS